jgi:hypothetical protein
MSYHLQDIPSAHKDNPRTFLKPTDEDISSLKIGDLVRLFFVFDFVSDDGCRAERMWVEISEINGDQFAGYLNNQPRYLKDIHVGDLVRFERKNIATVLVPLALDESQKAIISPRALEKRQINWALRSPERHHESDSGWQLYFGDETEEYLDSIRPSLITLKDVLAFEPRLEEVFAGTGSEYEWDEAIFGYLKVK